MTHFEIDADLGSRFAQIALGHVGREYPQKLDHVLESDADLLPPRALHPVFFGSFDWHSCVHSWWSLLTLRRQFPGNAEAAAIADLADATFTADKLAIELAYLDRPSSRGFERPYGWGWLLYLHLEAERHGDRQWGALLRPLADAFAARFKDYLAVLTYPVRVGTHFNTAFALILAQEWAEAFDSSLATLIGERVRSWFGNDRAAQAWEPSGDDFLSPTLVEAACMASALPGAEAAEWLAAFLPNIGASEPATLFAPAIVSDRSDGKIAHLDGLNLSRAWCWRRLAPLLPDDQSAIAMRVGAEHLSAAMPHIAGDYAGEHWLVTFAILAYECRAA